MNGDTKRRLALGFASNVVSKLANTVIQLIQIPVFLHYWSVPLFGEWMLVSAIPAYLSFSSVGFGSVAGNEMTMSIAAGDQGRALRIFQSCWWLIVAIGCAVGAGLCLALYLLPIGQILNLHYITSLDANWVIFFLGVSVLVGQLEQLLQSAYTCVGRYPYGTFVKSCLMLVAFAVMLVAVALRGTARDVALWFAVANVCGTILLFAFVCRDIPWISFGWRHASRNEIRRLLPPATAFMAFPLGNALNLQGSLLAVGYFLGPVDVVIFGTARTVSRIALQMFQVVNITFWPEISSAFGAGNEAMVRALHRRSCQAALILSLFFIVCIFLLGPTFLLYWTGGNVVPNRTLLGILLLVVLFNTFWSTSSTVVVAINQHKRLATLYLFATAATVMLTALFARTYGIYGAAASLLASEITMSIYVLPNSLRVSGDTFALFVESLFRLPVSLHPQEMMALLRRVKAKLGE